MQGESSVTQSGWTRTADPRELLPKILAKTDLAKRDLAKILAKILGKKIFQEFLGTIFGETPQDVAPAL